MSIAPSAYPPAPGRTRQVMLGYVAMLIVAVLVFLAARHYGERLVPFAAPTAHPTGEATAPAPPGGIFVSVLFALAVITLAARGMGAFFDKVLKQPAVMGEIVAGILLGPSVLGALSSSLREWVMPTAAAPEIGIIAKIGVVLFMFLVGLETDGRLLRRNPHTVLLVSHASILVPFSLGACLAVWLYPRFSYVGISFEVFALFTGVALSVTAFPVLARILADRRVQHTPLGVMAIACAALQDATAWCLLAVVSGVATAQVGQVRWTLLGVVVYVVAMLVAVKPAVKHLAEREEKLDRPVSLSVLAVVFAGLLLSATATERIGIHALFGAFLFGAVIPHEGRLAEQVRARLEDVVVVLFLPVFFAFTGMRTEIGLISSASDWWTTGVIILVATVGKVGGAFIAGKMAGLDSRESSVLGVLMNTRGLMELIVLNAGLDMGVLSPTLFTMLVVMALVTTFSTTPLLYLVTRGRGIEAEASPSTGLEHV